MNWRTLTSQAQKNSSVIVNLFELYSIEPVNTLI